MSTQVPISISAWWLIIMPVLSMLLIAVIVLIVINIVNTKQKKITEVEVSNNSKSEDGNSKDKTLTSWIKKKDLLYWLLIVCLGTISLFTFRYKDATEVISHWGFAGTIVSIILAVIAIGFTLFQTLSSNLSSEKIADSALRIESVSKNLDYEKLSKSSEIMNESATYLKEQLPLLKKEIEELKKGQEEQNSKLGMIDGYFSTNQDNAQSTKDILSLENFFNEVYPKLAILPSIFIYVHLNIIYSNKILSKDKLDELYNILAEIKMNTEEEKSKQRLNYLRGANMGSNGSAYTLLENLGVIKMFKDLNSNYQEEFINQMENKFEGSKQENEQGNEQYQVPKEFYSAVKDFLENIISK